MITKPKFPKCEEYGLKPYWAGDGTAYLDRNTKIKDIELALSKAEQQGKLELEEKYGKYIRTHDLSLWCERERFKEWRRRLKSQLKKEGRK